MPELPNRRFAGPIKCVGYSTGPDGAITELQAEFDADYQGKKPPKVRSGQGSGYTARRLVVKSGRTQADPAEEGSRPDCIWPSRLHAESRDCRAPSGVRGKSGESISAARLSSLCVIPLHPPLRGARGTTRQLWRSGHTNPVRGLRDAVTVAQRTLQQERRLALRCDISSSGPRPCTCAPVQHLS